MEIPPVSKVTALPTSPIASPPAPPPEYRRLISCGSCALPCETAIRPPMPRSAISVAAQHLDLDRVVGAGDLPGAVGEIRRGDHVRGQCLELPGAVRRLGRHARAGDRAVEVACGARRRDDQALQGGGRGIVRVARLEAVEPEGGEDRPLDEPGGQGRGRHAGTAGFAAATRRSSWPRSGAACATATAAQILRRSGSSSSRLPSPTTRRRRPASGRSRVCLRKPPRASPAPGSSRYASSAAPRPRASPITCRSASTASSGSAVTSVRTGGESIDAASLASSAKVKLAAHRPAARPRKAPDVRRQ